MSDKISRWGIIGVGDVTEKKSGPVFSKISGSKLVAVNRRNFEKAQDYAHRHNVQYVFQSADELINHPEVDAVYIATPPDSHAASSSSGSSKAEIRIGFMGDSVKFNSETQYQ